MSRKMKRALLHSEADRHHRTNKWVHKVWELLQNGKYGDKVRKINAAKGTHPKRQWRMRVLAVIDERGAKI